ncbi:MAG: hypothetical protein AB1611_04110 [bacterium]
MNRYAHSFFFDIGENGKYRIKEKVWVKERDGIIKRTGRKLGYLSITGSNGI